MFEIVSSDTPMFKPKSQTQTALQKKGENYNDNVNEQMSFQKKTSEFDFSNLKPFLHSQTKVPRRTKYLKLIKSLTSHASQITQI